MSECTGAPYTVAMHAVRARSVVLSSKKSIELFILSEHIMRQVKGKFTYTDCVTNPAPLPVLV